MSANGSPIAWVSFKKEQKAAVRADLEFDVTWRSFQMKRVQRSVTEMTPEMRAELRALNYETLKRRILKPNASVGYEHNFISLLSFKKSKCIGGYKVALTPEQRL